MTSRTAKRLGTLGTWRAKRLAQTSRSIVFEGAPRPRYAVLESLLHIEDVRKAKSIDFAVVFVTTRAEVDAAVKLIERNPRLGRHRHDGVKSG